jgi:hypothetical protein
VAAVAYFLPSTRWPLTVLKAFVAFVASLLPAWFYFRFQMSSRIIAVWDEYVLNLYRLGWDQPSHLPRPPKSSAYFKSWYESGGPQLDSGQNIYQRKFAAHYGDQPTLHAPDSHGQLSVGVFLPVMLATAIIAVGWIGVLWGNDLLGVLHRSAQVLSFGFLGAYVFILHTLLRRFVQGTLQASTYLSAIVRIVTVLIVLTALSALWLDRLEPGQANAIAFGIGLFPPESAHLLKERIPFLFPRTAGAAGGHYPLSDLDGMTLWYENRLREEGIEDMQNLVTANLVDLILNTHVPVGRLIDWIDQAHLYVHLTPASGSDRPQGRTGGRERLRQLGIRTATDLEDAFRVVDADAVLPPKEDEELRRHLRWVLNKSQVGSDEPSVTQAILKTLQHEQGLVHVRRWKRPELQATPSMGGARGVMSGGPVPETALKPAGTPN